MEIMEGEATEAYRWEVQFAGKRNKKRKAMEGMRVKGVFLQNGEVIKSRMEGIISQLMKIGRER